MSAYIVTRAHLKSACDSKNWDLLDKLLELDASAINDNALYTDTWGDWWGLLVECIRNDQIDGLRVLLKHGALRDLKTWGDSIPYSPEEIASEKPDMLALLKSDGRPSYVRKSDPPLPDGLTAAESAVNRQGAILKSTGLAFPN